MGARDRSCRALRKMCGRREDRQLMVNRDIDDAESCVITGEGVGSSQLRPRRRSSRLPTAHWGLHGGTLSPVPARCGLGRHTHDLASLKLYHQPPQISVPLTATTAQCRFSAVPSEPRSQSSVCLISAQQRYQHTQLVAQKKRSHRSSRMSIPRPRTSRTMLPNCRNSLPP